MKEDKSLTKISGNNINAIKNRDMTPKEIIEFLENGAIFRTFRDILGKVYPGEDLNSTLAKRLTEMTGGKYESISRNVRNWLNKDEANIPQREQLFQICFALELSEAQANQVLSSASGTAIHYRNPEELIYAYCLKKGKSWKEAQRLKEAMLPVYEEESRKREALGTETVRFTRQIRDDFEKQVDNDEDLEGFFRSHGRYFGVIHDTAYREFMRMLDLLQNPEKKYDDKEYDYMREHLEEYSQEEREALMAHDRGIEKYSIGTVVDEFFRMHVPANTPKAQKNRKKGSQRDYTYLQRVIKKNWPSENVLSKMKLREIDVSRKVMLLLFVLTEEFEVADPRYDSREYSAGKAGNGPDLLEDFDYLDDLENEEDAGERMEIRLTQMNLFLDRFGMNRLDPGNPFDCLVLYALKASYEGEEGTMDNRLQTALKALFGDDAGEGPEKIC